MSWGSVAIAGGMLVSAGIGYLSSENAADAQGDAADDAASTEMAMYNRTRADLAPWRKAGEEGLNTLQDMVLGKRQPGYAQILTGRAGDVESHWISDPGALQQFGMTEPGFHDVTLKEDRYESQYITDPGALQQIGQTERAGGGPGEFTESPGYQFTLNEGLNAQQNALSAMGANRSGKHIKAATDYAEGMASTEYDNFLSRWYQSLTPYQSMAGIGLTGAQTTAQAGSQAAGGVANAQIYGGNAQAQGYINQGNALTGAMQGGANQLLYLNSLRNLNQPTGGTGANWGGYAGNDPYAGNYGIR